MGEPGANGKAPAPVFVHLKVHSDYSLLESTLSLAKLLKLAEAAGMPAVGLTDTNNLFGALDFSEKLAQAGIQPIIGVALAIDFAAPQRGADNGASRLRARHRDGLLTLLAMSERGYGNLIKLVSRAYLCRGDTESPHVTFDELQTHAEGVIALTGGPGGPIDGALREGLAAVAQKRIQDLNDLFGDRLYVEIQRHGLKHEIETEPELIDLAYRLELPLVATNECRFAAPEDYEAFDVLTCIATGCTVADKNRCRLNCEFDFKSAAAMAKLFSDLPEALANTIEIAKRCAFRPKARKPILPRFLAAATDGSEAERVKAEAAELRMQAEAGLRERLAASPPAPGFSVTDYETRLAYELDVIAKMKFPGYFLIVADFVKWAKANGIPVGPGRGSGAGSVVAWALTITDLDPLRFGLLFERFLNPERVSMPDFDIDFCQERRDEVIGYVQRRYGADRVAQIITHGKLQARAVLRDVGRVLQMPYGQVDKLAKLVPHNPTNPVALAEAIQGEPKLQEARASDPLVARVLEIAQKLEGLYRHASTHAAGIVIADRPLDVLVPLYRDPKSSFPITQFNWKMVEAAGLVKFDLLGLKTLTVLQKAVELIRRGRGIDIDLSRLPLDDPKTYDLLGRADTAGVFQLESTGMRESLKRLKPDRFEDIIAMVALYRPGPMDNIAVYINRKHGLEKIDYLHPLLEPILKETHGVIIYQEQVMQIAQAMAGYSPAEADLLRLAMGKKNKREMARQKSRFVEGALKNGVARADAEYIFELVDKFAGYGFNKSHAAAYALVSYRTAYVKANFREEFLAASMTLDAANTDKLAMYAAEAAKAGIAILPPCINASDADFLAEPKGIRYSLAALKNVGAQAVASLVAERNAGGPYKDLSDFARRLKSRALNKRALETLSAAGAFDALESDRALVHGNVERMLALAERAAANTAEGTKDLFGDGSAASAPALEMRSVKPWSRMERLQYEFEAVGFYLSGHPLDAYASFLPKLGVCSYAELEARAERGGVSARLAAVVVSVRERKSQRGNKFAFALFSDRTAQFEAVVFSDTLARSRDLLESGTAVLVSVEGEREGEGLKLRVQALEPLEGAAQGLQRGVKVVLDQRRLAAEEGGLDDLQKLLKPGGKAEVRLYLRIEEMDSEVELIVPGRYDLGPQQQTALSTLPGVLAIQEF
jgi:DNA polymerase-3 subunit alpha